MKGVIINELSYLKGNSKLIKELECFYQQPFDSKRIFEYISNGNLCNNFSIAELFQFRVFLNSCLMLFNKEKMEKDYFKNNFEYIIKGEESTLNRESYDMRMQFYGDILHEDDTVKNWLGNINILERESKEGSVLRNRIAIFEPEAESPYDVVRRLRNSFAHMQYKIVLYEMPEKNLKMIPYLLIYNKDGGKERNRGVAFEQSINHFVDEYYSNQATFGIPYKHSFFAEETLGLSSEFYFYTVTYKWSEGGGICSSGDRNHPMIEYNSHQKDRENPEEIFSFLDTDPNFVIKKTRVENIVEIKNYKCYGRRLNKDEVGWLCKLLYDFETEFSNFVLHIRRLIEVSIYYRNTKNKDKLGEIVKEFDEDRDDIVAFNSLFVVLDLYNILLRIESDDLAPISYDFIDHNKFDYEGNDLYMWTRKYYENNGSSKEDRDILPRKFLLLKIRNAIAHGRLRMYLHKGELHLEFLDNYNNRKIKVSAKTDEIRSMLGKFQW